MIIIKWDFHWEMAVDMLKVKIEKQLNDFYLDVDFTVADETMAILGASGCGKSMTLKCIAGIETPDRGYIEFNGRVFFDSKKNINLSPQQRRAGYLFQNYALFPNMTVEQNIAFVAKGSNEEKKAIVEQNINRFHLQGLEKSYPTNLSGGQQQRAALARILAAQAELLMLDEPFSALDSYLKWELELDLAGLLEKYNKTTLFVSHNRDEVYRLCKRVAVMNKGVIEVVNDRYTIFDNPQTAAATVLTGCKNMSAARKIDDFHLYAIDWQLELTSLSIIPDDLQYVGVRAHFFLIERDDSAVNSFRAHVDKVIENPFSFIVMIRPYNTGCQRMLRWELSKNKWQQLQNKDIYVSMPPEKIILLTK
ncbi:sulfate/molybdate ABC transporter ATP-binding protein [Pectinatus brassicae]|uniref:Molybdate transport system ATP-binding protein n=1 Tax=Pectinatus brassicae TaxID=862415 RepID=A0A840UBH1_9FIRM|nr:ATP-binding cassette domain-containing protein [Pectinatus brassicae]MBB5335061.1 molybdate transport system ATP-binding protein [Pectinatus brassicae]